MSFKHYMQDVLQLSLEGFRKGEVSRRDFLTICAMAGVAAPTLLSASESRAAAKDIVLWNWGGDAAKCHTQAFGAPFSKDTGMGFKIDGTGPLEGKIKKMVESGKITADVADADAFNAISLGKQGLLEPIDYSVVDKKKIIPGFAFDHGVSIIFYGYALMYDTKKFGSNPPSNWADFFDTKKYPGKRSLYKWANGSLEGALVADGVAKDKLYPLDVPRALKKIKSIKKDSIYWGSGAESQAHLVNAEVSMGIVWQNRAKVIEADTGGRFRMIMNEAIAMPGAWVVPKGNPAGRKAVMQFIAACQKPERQVAMFKCHGMTPSNPEAFPMIPKDLHRFAITLPENFKKVIPVDSAWWAANGGKAVNAYLEAIG